MNRILRPLSRIFRGATTVRNWAFDRGLLKISQLKSPVISVGNLTAGGTGKTPFVCWLLENLRQKGLSVGVISRGYGGDYKGIVRVSGTGNWKSFGDEPTMLARKFPDLPIFLSRRRAAAGEALLRSHPVQLILADDAFQHRYLARQMDIVLLDLTQDLSEYEPLPYGRAREALSALQRAHWVVFTKGNLLPETEKEKKQNYLMGFIRNKQNVLEADLVTEGLFNHHDRAEDVCEQSSIYLISGIGRPQSFETSVKTLLQKEIAKHWVFPDHHSYGEKELRGIFESLPRGAQLITTEKDKVRLERFPQYSDRFLALRVGFKVSGPLERFYDEMDRQLR